MTPQKATSRSHNKRARDEHDGDGRSPRKRRRVTSPPPSERRRNPSCTPDEERVNRFDRVIVQLPLTSPPAKERCSNPSRAPEERVAAQAETNNTTVTASLPSQAADHISAQPTVTTAPTTTNPSPSPIPPIGTVSGPLRIDYTNARPSVFNFVDCTHASRTHDIPLAHAHHAILALRLVPVCLTCRKAKKKEFKEGADNCGCIANICGPLYCGHCWFTAYRETVQRARFQIEWLDPRNHRHSSRAKDGEIVAPEEFMIFDYTEPTFVEIKSELRARGIEIRATGNTKAGLVAKLTESDKESWQLCPCGRAASESGDDTVMHCTSCDGYVVRRSKVFDLDDPVKENNATTGKFGLTHQEWESIVGERRKKERKEQKKREKVEERQREKTERKAAQLRMRRVLRSIGFTDEDGQEVPQNEGTNTSVANPDAQAPPKEHTTTAPKAPTAPTNPTAPTAPIAPTAPSGSAPNAKADKSTEPVNEESKLAPKGKGKKSKTLAPPTRVSTRTKTASLKAKENAGK